MSHQKPETVPFGLSSELMLDNSLNKKSLDLTLFSSLPDFLSFLFTIIVFFRISCLRRVIRFLWDDVKLGASFSV